MTAQLVIPTQVSIDASVYEQLKALDPINIDDSSFMQLSDFEAVVYAKVGADQKEWTLLMVWQNDRWMLGYTLEGREDFNPMDSSAPLVSSSTPVSGTTG